MEILNYVGEIWKPVLGYEGLYEVSNYGRVRSLTRYVTGRYNTPKIVYERILKPGIKKGYYFVSLCKDNKTKQLTVHRLVWSAFNGPIPEGMQVNHINENKLDNRLENLNLLTSGDNHRWGTCIQRGAANRRKKLQQFNLNGELLRTWDGIVDYEEEMKKKGIHISRGRISSCCHENAKTAYGYIWKYAD